MNNHHKDDIELKTMVIVIDEANPLLKKSSYKNISQNNSCKPSDHQQDIIPKTANPNYKLWKIICFMIIHCLGAFYFGFQMTILNNLGKPILKSSMNITNENQMAKCLGNFNLAFGIGKIFGSFFGGALQKLAGKRVLLYLAEILSILVMVLCCLGNYWLFLVGRVLCGFYCGIATTNSSRLITECFSVKSRGYTATIFALACTFAVMMSFCIGELFGENTLEKYWRLFICFPGVICQIKTCVMALLFNHDSPIYYMNLSVKCEDLAKKDIYSKKVDDQLLTFNPTYEEAQSAKILLEEMVADGDTVEKSFGDMVYQNCIARKSRWSFLANMFFNCYSPFCGQAYNDNYSTSIFDQLVYNGFGYKLTFYAGFATFGGCLFAVLFIEKFGRKAIIQIGFMGQVIIMYLMSIAFYYQCIPMAVTCSLCYSFILYFGTAGLSYIYPNEIVQPFNVGLGYAGNWVFKSAVSLVLPMIYENLPLYMTPLIMSVSGLVIFVFIRPTLLETKGKSFNQIAYEYENYSYSLCKY